MLPSPGGEEEKDGVQYTGAGWPGEAEGTPGPGKTTESDPRLKGSFDGR